MSIGSITEEFTNKGEIVYADDNKILTRMWNFRDCEFSKIDKSSKNIVLMTEAADAIIGSEQIMKSLERLAEYIKRFCGGEIDILMADIKESSEFLLK
jgi:DNA/RNA-binding domain of Phe-tRNA-synthetase-like protein